MSNIQKPNNSSVSVLSSNELSALAAAINNKKLKPLLSDEEDAPIGVDDFPLFPPEYYLARALGKMRHPSLTPESISEQERETYNEYLRSISNDLGF